MNIGTYRLINQPYQNHRPIHQLSRGFSGVMHLTNNHIYGVGAAKGELDRDRNILEF